MEANTVHTAGQFRVVLNAEGFTVRDQHDKFIAGVFSAKHEARAVAERWAVADPAPHSKLWWEMYLDENRHLDQRSLDNIAMLIATAKS